MILIGELGDLETAKSAIAAAETGHLVLSTLHTTNATETIHKIVDMFPEHQQKSARMMLASSLKGIICQKLITKVDGLGRVPACEVMTMTSRIFDRIVDPGDHALELEDIIADGEYYGMHTLDQSLLQLFGDSLVTRREALGNATNPTELRATMESIRSE